MLGYLGERERVRVSMAGDSEDGFGVFIPLCMLDGWSGCFQATLAAVSALNEELELWSWPSMIRN